MCLTDNTSLLALYGKTKLLVRKEIHMSLTYRTEVSWGNITEWHSAPNLVIDLNDGRSSPLAKISWQEQDGTTGSISFQSDLSSFLGYYQKPNEGPIAYRGRRV
jgi:hypothetical protein